MRRLVLATAIVVATAVWLLISTSITSASKLTPPLGDSPTNAAPPTPSRILSQRYVGASAEQIAAQRQALEAAPGARVQMDARGIPTQIYYEHKVYQFPTDTDSAQGRVALQNLLVSVRTLLLGEGTETLTQDGLATSQLHTRTIVFKQSIRGIPVSDAKVALMSDDRTGKLAMVTAHFLPDRGLPTEPRLSASDALREALAYIDRAYELEAHQPRAKNGNGVVPDQRDEETRLPERTGEVRTRGETSLSYRIGSQHSQLEVARLIWTVRLDPETSPFTSILVDAVDGTVVGVRRLDTLVRRNVYDSQNTVAQGVLKRLEGQAPVADAAVNTLYDNYLQAYHALAAAGSTGWNNEIFAISIRNTTQGPTNAWADAEFQRMGFGQGQTGISTHVGNALDAVGHEWSHAISWKKNSLQCTGFDCAQGASGLDEGLGDIAGTAVDMYWSRAFPWRQGEDAFTNGLAFRDAATPLLINLNSRDWYPERSLSSQHANATILTHAFYLLANGGQHYRAGLGTIPIIPVTGIGHAKAKNVIYGALLGGALTNNHDFNDMLFTTANRALTLYGSSDRDAVIAAFNAVGVTGCTTPPQPPGLWAEDICPWWKLILQPVAGATTYHSQYSRYPSYAPAGDFHDSPATGECELYTDVWIYFRARACNACGCSGWSPNAIITPWPGECP